MVLQELQRYKIEGGHKKDIKASLPERTMVTWMAWPWKTNLPRQGVLLSVHDCLRKGKLSCMLRKKEGVHLSWTVRGYTPCRRTRLCPALAPIKAQSTMHHQWRKSHQLLQSDSEHVPVDNYFALTNHCRFFFAVHNDVLLMDNIPPEHGMRDPLSMIKFTPQVQLTNRHV